jgi:hypothetical protein
VLGGRSYERPARNSTHSGRVGCGAGVVLRAVAVDWVRDPDALRTLLALRALQVGDEVIERTIHNHGGPPLSVTSKITPGLMHAVYQVYGKNLQGTGTWELAAWRRP